ncbi:MAG: histidine kinase dimerization/phospho-acceptor domain-containing protein, partial [Nocardioides sp.]
MSGAASALTSTGVGSRLLLTDDPDPRVLQGVFALLFALDFALRSLGGTELTLGTWPAHAVSLALAVCGVAALIPWERVPRSWVWVLPVLDIGALGMSRMSEEGSSAGVLVVLPALWLGRQFGRTGALVATVAATLLLAVPGLVYLGPDNANLARSLMIPVVAGWAALAIASGLERLQVGASEAEHRGRELAEALDTIAHQRRFADAILDTVDVGLVLLDRTGAYQSMNRRHGDFMRLAYPDGHAGRAGQLGLVYAADGVTALVREEMPTHRAAQGEEFDDCRIWVGEDPLTKRALSVSARTVRDEQGQFAGAALAYKDVTDFMRALRVKDEFVASVSHELRTPLTSIMGYVDLMLDRPDLPEQQAAHLEVVARNSDRLRRLVADLLHTAQVDDG